MPEIIPCDECCWFRPIPEGKLVPTDAEKHLCGKGHSLKFKLPIDYPGGAPWGFHLPGCRDRMPAIESALISKN